MLISQVAENIVLVEIYRGYRQASKIEACCLFAACFLRLLLEFNLNTFKHLFVRVFFSIKQEKMVEWE